MSTDPRVDVVSGQYERWMYPEPIMDLPAWLEHNWQWFDPSHAHRVLWPDRPYPSDLEILVAGCGTNQAAVLAYTNPGARITAIDVSQPSLDHHSFLRQRYGLRNLELNLLPIEDVATLERDFDLVISTGVLHHLADPQVGMNALAGVLRTSGVMALMLYARYGRIGVEILEDLFRELGLEQDDASIAVVKDAIAAVPSDHPVRSYLAVAPDLSFDAGIVDTFLHGRERSYTVGECLDLVASAGLTFQDWFLKSPYEPGPAAGNRFLESVARLPDRERWSVMERINSRNGCHFFTCCRADRPVDEYRIDFANPRALTYVPAFRYRTRLEGADVVGPSGRTTLEPADASLIGGIDGRRDIAQLADAAAMQSDAALEVVRSLWLRDSLALGVPASR